VREPAGHLRTEVRAREPGDSARTVISAGREVELGARSMLILVEGQFRLDVVPHEDTIQTVIRCLGPEPRAELRGGDVGGKTVFLDGPDAIEPRSTGNFGGEIVLIGDDGSEHPVARILVGSVCHLERGVTSFTAQAELL